MHLNLQAAEAYVGEAYTPRRPCGAVAQFDLQSAEGKTYVGELIRPGGLFQNFNGYRCTITVRPEKSEQQPRSIVLVIVRYLLMISDQCLKQFKMNRNQMLMDHRRLTKQFD